MVDKRKLPFFVYGTLRFGEHNFDRCLKGRYEDVKSGTVKAVMYDFGCPVIVRTKKDKIVKGDVFFIGDELYDYVMAVLDSLEGFNGTKDSLYSRETVEVELDEGGTIECWAYFGEGILSLADPNNIKKIEEGDWIEYQERKARESKKKNYHNLSYDDLPFDERDESLWNGLSEEEYYEKLFGGMNEEDYETPWKSIPFSSKDDKK